jgi:hypothetical protein
MFFRAARVSSPVSSLLRSTEKIDWPRPSSSPRSPRSTSTATSGSSNAGNTEVTTWPPELVGANRPVTASWLVRRCSSSVTPGRANFVAPSDNSVVWSTGRHWTSPVRCWPSG